MRQRRPKDLKKRLMECSENIIETPVSSKWREYFGNDNPIFLEIGCGKGNFIVKKAIENPNGNFIAIEGQDTVILRALEKAKAAETQNLRFVMAFLNNMSDMFEENQLDGIYLNFSDPWPKARHAKRRLTYRERLFDYKWAVKPGGFAEIKTDNDGLYEFTLKEIKALGYDIVEQTENLHESEYESKYTTTEYEEKFRNSGKNINYVKIMF